jgi:hypothetical protein
VNCFPTKYVGTQVVSVFEFWQLDRLLFMARDLTTATFLLCHQKLSCFVIENFPACHRKLSRFVIENFPALSSKTFMLCHRKLSCFVILSVVRRQPNGAEGPHARVQRPWPVQASPTTTPTAL